LSNSGWSRMSANQKNEAFPCHYAHY